MGCDIHLRLEKLNIKTNTWVDCNLYDKHGQIVEPYTGRNYSLFAYLAGVRNNDDVDPIAEHRGFPNNASNLSTEWMEDWNCDMHSITYYTLAELQEAATEINDNSLTYFTNCIESAANAFYCDWTPEQFRVIIGFDN